jgi:AraC family transcriptional regulator
MKTNLSEATARGGYSKAQLDRINDYIVDHIGEPIRVSELSVLVNTSSSHFSRRFRATTGTTPQRHVRHHRLALAANLVRTTELPLALIAQQCGFADQSHFCRHFHQYTGTNPGEWRRRVQTLRDRDVETNIQFR